MVDRPSRRYRELVLRLGQERGQRWGWKTEVARLLKVDPSLISRVAENEDVSIGRDVLTRATEALGLPPNFFFDPVAPERFHISQLAFDTAAPERFHISQLAFDPAAEYPRPPRETPTTREWSALAALAERVVAGEDTPREAGQALLDALAKTRLEAARGRLADALANGSDVEIGLAAEALAREVWAVAKR